MVAEMYRAEDNEMANVNGGTFMSDMMGLIGNNTVKKFNVGDRVTHRDRWYWGKGVILSAQLINYGWMYVVVFPEYDNRQEKVLQRDLERA